MASSQAVHRRLFSEGYLLIEVMISISVLVLVALSLIAVTNYTLQTSLYAQRLTFHAMTARRYFETYRHDLLNDFGFTPLSPVLLPDVKVESSVDCPPSDPPSCSQVKRIKVAVSHRYDASLPKSEIIGLVSKRN